MTTLIVAPVTRSTGDIEPRPSMTYCQPTKDDDDGLFYVRVWLADSEHCSEEKFTSLKAAHESIAAIYAAKCYSRVELLHAREWGTRTTTNR